MTSLETFFAMPGRALLQVIEAQERAIKAGDRHLANNYRSLGIEIATLIREAAEVPPQQKENS